MPAPKKPIIILGIDPGLADTGFGIIKKTGQQLKVLDFGSIKTKAKTPIENRLEHIYQALIGLIDTYHPAVVAVEQLFFFKNVSTAIVVSQARGVVLLAAGQKSALVQEFAPLQIKMALTAYGRASKKQIQKMVKLILGLKTIPKSDDAADALAVAICCAHSKR